MAELGAWSGGAEKGEKSNRFFHSPVAVVRSFLDLQGQFGNSMDGPEEGLVLLLLGIE